MPDSFISLWTEQEKEQKQAEGLGSFHSCDPSLTSYPAKDRPARAAVIVCPGGGYQIKSEHEGTPVAQWLSDLGFDAHVLDYRVHPDRHPSALQDAARAIETVRQNASSADRVGILGFSAGGHVAATAATMAPNASARPDFLILAYPVICLDEHAHAGSRRHLLGDKDDPALRRRLSLDRQVGPDTPPTFLWHTVDDAVVPVQNSLRFAKALADHSIPFACHLFAKGPHGLGLAKGVPEVEAWTSHCQAFLESLGI